MTPAAMLSRRAAWQALEDVGAPSVSFTALLPYCCLTTSSPCRDYVRSFLREDVACRIRGLDLVPLTLWCRKSNSGVEKKWGTLSGFKITRCITLKTWFSRNLANFIYSLPHSSSWWSSLHWRIISNSICYASTILNLGNNLFSGYYCNFHGILNPETILRFFYYFMRLFRAS